MTVEAPPHDRPRTAKASRSIWRPVVFVVLAAALGLATAVGSAFVLAVVLWVQAYWMIVTLLAASAALFAALGFAFYGKRGLGLGVAAIAVPVTVAGVLIGWQIFARVGGWAELPFENGFGVLYQDLGLALLLGTGGYASAALALLVVGGRAFWVGATSIIIPVLVAGLAFMGVHTAEFGPEPMPEGGVNVEEIPPVEPYSTAIAGYAAPENFYGIEQHRAQGTYTPTGAASPGAHHPEDIYLITDRETRVCAGGLLAFDPASENAYFDDTEVLTCDDSGERGYRTTPRFHEVSIERDGWRIRAVAALGVDRAKLDEALDNAVPPVLGDY